MEKKILVTGAGGFIGSHLVKFLKNKGYFVRGVDLKFPEYSDTHADEFFLIDLKTRNGCFEAVSGMDEVYQLAADMGGMGFISKEHIASLHNSNLINTYVAEACSQNNTRLFFSSSACVYPTHRQSELNSVALGEEEVYPAHPNEAYGWEKLLAEIRYQAYTKEGKLTARIARFGNTYGPEGTYKDGREKAPAALCRKVAEAKDGGEIEVWGDGLAQRSYQYIDDLVEGIYALMKSEVETPVNLGSEEVVSVNELAQIAIDVSGKKLTIKNVPGPEGVRSRFISHQKAHDLLGWKAKVTLREGIKNTYDWINGKTKSHSN